MPVKSSSFKRKDFRTTIEIEPMVAPATYHDRIMLIGSCFTENIGNRLKSMKFTVDLNPFGIVYNPLSMAGQLNYLLKPTAFQTDDLVFHQELWYSWIHHGRFSHPEADKLLQVIDNQIMESSRFLEQSGLLMLTFGTPEAYYLKSNNRLVSNCHQVNADQFYTRKPGVNELMDLWVPLIDSLLSRNRNLRICLTISPVRYIRNGPTGNQVNKSILLLFIDALLKTYDDLFYFPAYELFMDDLRDYRFYDEDMMHPGANGIEYVWSNFVKACIKPSVYPVMEEVDSVIKAASHRPGGFVTNAHRQFISVQMDRISKLQNKHPFLDFSQETISLQKQLISE
jgi:hypothetical protein